MTMGLNRGRLLADQIADVLRQEILAGTREPGSKLPTEQQMADMFGVSRAAIREAVSRLKQDGLVQSRQGLGAFVSETGASTAFRIEGERLDRHELALIFELRRPLEVEAAGLAASRRTKAHLKQMREAMAQMAKAIELGADGSQSDARFHRSIAEASANHYFIEFMSFLEGSVRGAIATARQNTARYPGLGTTVEKEHEAVFLAIEAGDEARARDAMFSHLSNAAARLDLQPKKGAQARAKR
ncbi:FadR/GntR family transcriptional regulator [Rhodoligotrophos defluvii]|uniref:FadR/GntR family transcriptional regulator n=1 Tax=Rhodoligotrophos defluvii TaxID=2561934 RepID=UPI0010C94D4D|nr:FadR/GntR family transcriptional regulator [Rhodoligotrophos defluvii]